MIEEILFFTKGGCMKRLEVKKCDLCGQPTSFERFDESWPPEGERVDCCDMWVCADCVCWEKSDESRLVCKDCCNCYESESSSSVTYSKQYLK
jgi:hypothetical protein